MSDYFIGPNGDKYYHESYIELANKNARRSAQANDALLREGAVAMGRHLERQAKLLSGLSWRTIAVWISEVEKGGLKPWEIKP